MKNRVSILIFSFFIAFNLMAQDEFEDINRTTQEVLKKAYEMLEKSKKIIESFTKTEQEAIPEKKDNFLLYYKRVKNTLPVESRNDILISSQIKYRLAIEKGISSGNILVLCKNGVVELFGKLTQNKKLITS